MPQHDYKRTLANKYGMDFGEMGHDWSKPPMRMGTGGEIDQWTMDYKAQEELPQNTAWQNESEYLRKGTGGTQAVSAQANPNGFKVGVNAAQLSQTALTTPMLGDSLGGTISNNTSVTDFGPVTASVGPAFTGSEDPNYKYNAPNTAAGSGGTYSLPEVSVTADKKPWYGDLPNTEGQQTIKPMQVGANLDWSQQMANTQYAQQMERQVTKRKEAQVSRIDNIWDPGLPDTANQGAAGTPGQYAPLENANPYDTMEKVSEKNALETRSTRDEWKDVVESGYGQPDSSAANSRVSMDREMSLQALKGPDTSKDIYREKSTADDWFSQNLSAEEMDPGNVTGATPGFNESGGMIDYIPKSLADKTLGSKITEGFGKVKEGLGKAGAFAEKAAPYVAFASTVKNVFDRHGTAGKAIDNLRTGISALEGVVDSAANVDHAEEDAMSAEFSEGRRKIGGRTNLALGESLDRVKGSNLNTGSIKKIKEDIRRKYDTSADLDLAGAEDAFNKKKSDYVLKSREDRAKNNLKLKQLRAELEAQEKAASPLNAVADISIAALSIANPALGMGLSLAKSQIA
jgi:hypothetical protein